MPDIDIDFADREQALKHFKYITASRKDGEELVKHNTGVYMQEVPVHAPKNLCAVSYKEAEALEYFKIDFLNVSLYNGVKDEAHLEKLMQQEPLWELLEEQEIVDQLFHVNGHVDILRSMKPRSIEQLAAVLAVIRPAKRYLIGKDWTEVLADVWVKPTDDEYYFKKSHATAYAVGVIVQLNLLCENVS